MLALAILAVLIASIGAYLLYVMLGPGIPVCKGHTYVFVLFPLFRYEEFSVPYSALKKLGASIEVLCPGSAKGTVLGIDERNRLHLVKCKNVVSLPVNADTYILVGGPGLTCILLNYLVHKEYIANSSDVRVLLKACDDIAHAFNLNYSKYYTYIDSISSQISQLAQNRSKIIVAICVAPTLLCLSNVLHGGNITMAPVEPLVKFVENRCGVRVESSKPLVVRDNIVTVRGPEESALNRLILQLVIYCKFGVKRH